MIKLLDILNEAIEEEKKKADRCLRIARREYGKKSTAYRSGAIVRCRQGDIWKDLKEEELPESFKLDDIKNVYEENSELSQIGNIEQYSNYLNSIFPDSKIKDIVYHASPNKIEKFRDTMFGTYFSYSPIKGVYGSAVNSALINVKSPLIKPKPTDSAEEKIAYDREYRNYNNPSSPYDGSIEGSTVTEEGIQIRVKNPEQIHILGSKQDIEGFRKFTGKLNEKKESLHKWFSHRGGGWVDCNTCRDGKCKQCGRQKGEERAKYPSCRPTPAACKDKGKGKTWGKTK